MILNSLAWLLLALSASNSIANHVWPTPQPTPILKCCIKDCFNRPNGNYQSCHGCQYYATCLGGTTVGGDPTISFWDKRPCPASTYWDDISKNCVQYHSRTCAPPQWDSCGNPECGSFLPKNPCECHYADYVFVLDGSGSISDDHFADSKDWLIDIVNNHIHSYSQISAIQFDDAFQWIHEFSDTQYPRNTFINAVNSETQMDGATNIYLPLNAAISALNTISDYGQQKIIILLTDGGHNEGDPLPCTLSGALSATNIRLVVIGLDNTDPGLDCLNPKNTIVVDDFDFDALTTHLEDCQAICHECQDEEPGV